MSSIMKGLVNETEAKKGADGKRCWKGKRYAGTENGKDKCIPVKNEAANPAQQAAIAVNMKKKGQKPKHVDEARAKQYVKPYNDPQTGEQIGWKSSDGYHVKYWQKFAKDSAIKHAKLNPDEVQEDYTGEFAAEKTPETNPYGGQRDRQHRGAISETPTDNPTGASGEGGWRKYKPKSAGEIDEAKKSEFRLKAEQQQLKQLEKINNSTLPHWAKEYLTLLTDPKGKVFKAAYYSFGKGQDARKEAAEYIMQKYKIPQEWIDKINLLKGSHVTKNREEDRHFNWDMPSMHEDTSYAGGGGQGGNAGESYRKFKPKSAGTFNEEEQLDEKCWDNYKQVGMKNKGGKQVPNCVPKESAIMRGIQRESK